ncbi:MAG: hypothetical protein ABFC18_09140 [Rikenellaceae bacterium]
MVEDIELDDINEIYSDLKKKYWKPEWDSMSEEDMMKDPQYGGYLHEMLVVGLEYAKKKREECKEPVQIELMDEFVKFYEKSLKCFTPVKEG